MPESRYDYIAADKASYQTFNIKVSALIRNLRRIRISFLELRQILRVEFL